MRFALDILIVSRQGTVLKAAQKVPARRIVGAWGGFAVIEMAAGSLADAEVRRGDVLALGDETKVTS